MHYEEELEVSGWQIGVGLGCKFSHLMQRFVVGEAGVRELFGRGDFFQDSRHGCAYCWRHLAAIGGVL